jgi:hypothetical protein
MIHPFWIKLKFWPINCNVRSEGYQPSGSVNMTLQGKGIFIWRVRGCENGDVQAIADLAQAAGFTHVLLKVADGNFAYNIDTKTGEDLAASLTAALKARKIQVYGWHYVYAYDPKAEADRGIQRVRQLDLDGFVIDAEAEYKNQNRAANLYMDRLRAGLPNFPIGLSSYRYPALHPNLPWKEFLLKCDFNMPQVYWIGSHNPGDQLRRSLQYFQKITPFRPMIPTGAIFTQGDWRPSVAEIDDFVRTARELNMTAVNFWEWSKARRYLPEIWDWFAAYNWPGGTTASQDISQQFVAALNRHDPGKIVELYRQDAVHVTDAHAIQGVQQLFSYYTDLLKNLLPDGNFTLTSFSGNGSIRHLTWTAISRGGSVHNGSDTLGLVKDKIAYHYSDFSIN